MDPTKYNKFLRFVVTQWFSDENIDLSYLSTHVDSENDKKVNTMPLEDNITFVNFPIKSEHEKKSNQMKISNAHEKNLEVSKQLKNDFERSERKNLITLSNYNKVRTVPSRKN